MMGPEECGCYGVRSPGLACARLLPVVFAGLLGLTVGCATPNRDTPPPSPVTTQGSPLPTLQPTPVVGPGQIIGVGQRGSDAVPPSGGSIQPGALASPVRLAGYSEQEKPPSANAMANAQIRYPTAPPSDEAMPIDLPTALRLVDANSPTVALARDRVQEAYLRERDAELAWLPDLQAGTNYNRHDGRDQNSNGTIFEVSKQNLFVSGGATLDWDTAEILFGRLAAQRLTEAAQASARAVSSDVQLDVATAYLDLLQAYGEYAIDADALARAEEMLRNAESAEKAGLSKTTADINRARTEVDLRRERLFQLQAQTAVVSARLARLLLLRPTVILRPYDSQIVPVGLIPDLGKLDELVAIGLSTRPEVQQNRALIAAASTRWRQAQVGPLIPHLELAYRGGEFGGGVNSEMNDFGARSDGTAEAIWELHNFGAGDVIQSRIRRTQFDEANLNLADVQSRVAEEVTAAARTAQADQRSLDVAQEAVVQALETWRRLREASFGLAGAEHQYDPLQPLIALRDLADARTRYLSAVIDYNRSQFRLYWAMGQPPLGALEKLAPQPIKAPVVPGPYRPGAEEVPAPPKNAP